MTDSESSKRFYIPAGGLNSWQTLLADPSLHWKRGASAMELALSWELAAGTARGLPRNVAELLDAHPSTRDAELLFGFPEHRVRLPGGTRASQTDLWAVLKTVDGWASLAVEGKAREPFGPTVDEWLKHASEGKRSRLAALCRTLGLEPIATSPLRYQLFHRTASAVMEATRIGASSAILLVQSFYPESAAWQDFRSFVELFGAAACRNGMCEGPCPGVKRLLFAWADSPVATDAEITSLQAVTTSTP